MSHLASWGDNQLGQLGLGFEGRIIQSPAGVIVVGEGVKACSASGGGWSAALMSDGTVRGWGGNRHGQLGDGTQVDKYASAITLPLSDVKQFDTSGVHAIHLTADGKVHTIGGNIYGAIGDGNSGEGKETANALAPYLVTDGAVKVEAGGANCGYLTPDGRVFMWGEGKHGQLGNGALVPEQRHPAEVAGLGEVIDFSVGGIASVTGTVLALLADGAVVQWGRMQQGVHVLRPELVEGLDDVTKIVCGAGQRLAIKSDGSLWAWGVNTRGQLGVGAVDAVMPPTKVLDDVIDVAAGFQFTVALTSEGNVLVFGRNDLGELGDGTRVDKPIPTLLERLGDVQELVAGERHTVCVLRGATTPPPIHLSAGPGTLTATWEAPEAGGEWRPANRPITVPASQWIGEPPVPGNARSYTWAGLPSGVPRQVRITALYGAQGGPWTLSGTPL